MYTDLHCHILYGTDDGPETKQEMLEMLECAYSNGIRTICVTPHFNFSFYGDNVASADKAYGELKLEAAQRHPDMAIYAATKCAVMSLVRNVAKQVAPFGVTVNNLSPGVIATPRNDAALSDPLYAEKVMAGIPMHFAGEPSDMAGAALLLASDGGRYITGIDLVVDGGMQL